MSTVEIKAGRAHTAGNKLSVSKVLIYTALVIWALLSLFPVYWMLTFSLKDNAEIFGANVVGLPTQWLWSNYHRALTLGNMPAYFANSLVIAVVTILITLVAAVMATYAMTRLVWKGRDTMNKIFMLGLTIPIHAAILPLYVVLGRAGLLNSRIGLIIPYSAFSLAMAILISTGFMGDIPYDLDEAAFLDGCGVWGIFARVIAPLMVPAISTVGIYTFLQCWNELMFASIFGPHRRGTVHCDDPDADCVRSAEQADPGQLHCRRGQGLTNRTVYFQNPGGYSGILFLRD